MLLQVSRRWTWAWVGVVLVAACDAQSVELARAQWLRHTLVLDNQAFLERDPEQTGGKLAKMGEGPYAWFRGTAAQYARDVMEPGGLGYLPSAYESADTRDVALVGDPHPENIGSFARAPDFEIIIEFNDFDAATFGPYGFDLRRLALGFWIAGEQLLRTTTVDGAALALGEEHRTAAARAVARGYAAEIATLAVAIRQGSAMEADNEPRGAILEELAETARDDGRTEERLADYTRVEDGQRVMFYGDIDAPRVLEYGGFAQSVYEDTVGPVDVSEQQRLADLVSRYSPMSFGHTPRDAAALRLKGTSRRLGAGVSSYPVLRYYALLEGPSVAVEDDVLLELKQVLDAVPMPGLPRWPAQPFYTNAERVAVMQQRLQGTADADPWLGWVGAGADGYRFRWRTGYQHGLQISMLAEGFVEGEFTADDFVELAELAGRLLARSHGRAPKLDGRSGAPAIADAIAGDDEGLVEEVVGFVERYAPQVLADYDVFVELLETHGPRLGYVRR
jgi:uncharacterized protein (DUF2252 family)